MDSEIFLARVSELSGLEDAASERAAEATLSTLAERISRGEAEDLARRLPAELAPAVASRGDAEPFGLDEFLRRIGEREGVTPDEAHEHARAVMTSLHEAVGAELNDALSQLPEEFRRFVRH